ncbi:MAG: Na+/H+ antiporter NhaA, partial [Acidimicrobiaceae bacterium]|nr:Na+/H+ antiporter NhaA [Acidimicrobiaceae bacterium]
MAVGEEPALEQPAPSTSSTREELRQLWSRRSATPITVFVRTETAGAMALLGAAAVALVWANIDNGSYVRTWETVLTVRISNSGISMSLMQWINSGLMTLFFFVVGLEARREIDIGDLRERQRIIAPFLAGLGGMAAAVLVYLLINLG